MVLSIDESDITTEETLNVLNDEITKYMIENNISTDHKNPISVMLDKVYDLSDSLIEHPDYGMDDLEKISAKLSFAKEYIDEMVECNG